MKQQPQEPFPATNPGRERVRGVDTLRLIATLWVVFYHCKFIRTDDPKRNTTGFWASLLNAYDAPLSGQAAVGLFFVISGFCIHYPNRYVASLLC